MSRRHTSSPPQAPPWRVAGLLYLLLSRGSHYVPSVADCTVSGLADLQRRVQCEIGVDGVGLARYTETAAFQ
jgi:hypothetical protein